MNFTMIFPGLIFEFTTFRPPPGEPNLLNLMPEPIPNFNRNTLGGAPSNVKVGL